MLELLVSGDVTFFQVHPLLQTAQLMVLRKQESNIGCARVSCRALKDQFSHRLEYSEDLQLSF